MNMALQVWMRVAGAVCTVAGASGIGLWMAGQYGRRLEELRRLRQMIFFLKGQILYANATLEEAFEEVGGRMEEPLSRLLCQVAERMARQEGELFGEIWQDEVRRWKNPVLKKEDVEELAGLGTHLGYMDRDMQERTLLLYLEQLDLVIDGLQKQKQERCRMYSSLGVMGGLFLTILLI